MKVVLPVSKRGTVTLPPEIRKRFNISGENANPMVILEERDGELILSPATAIPIRDLAPERISSWIAEDVAEMDEFNATPPRSSPVKQ